VAQESRLARSGEASRRSPRAWSFSSRLSSRSPPGRQPTNSHPLISRGRSVAAALEHWCLHDGRRAPAGSSLEVESGTTQRKESPRPKSRLTRYQMTADRSSRPAPPRRTDRLWMPMRSRQARPPQIPVVAFLDRILVTCPVLVQRPVPLLDTDLRSKDVSRGASVTFQLSVSGPIFAVFATGNDHGGNK
jgi:hypothetical protein